MRNPYFQSVEQRFKDEHCQFCQSSVRITYCKQCKEITDKECLECDGYEQDNLAHVCELNFSGLSKRE